MHMILLVVDGTALMLGSLLGAVALSSMAWLASGYLHRRWMAFPLMAALLAGMLASPMEQSLFVRMMTVFCVVGAVVLGLAALEPQTPGPGARHR